ncbi:MAG TPA: acyltransferase [Thermoanaerobaculia bacterium]|jgi:acetyltransferase-like isoleucine patch superfamily enzyme
MFTLRGKIALRMGWRCIERGARVHGNVRLGSGTIIASGAELVARGAEQITLGDRCAVLRGSLLYAYGGRITIGSNTSINPYCVLYGHGGLTIGNDVLIATGCVIIPANHNIADVTMPIRAQGLTAKGIVIEDGVWLAARVTVLDGVRVGTGAVIGAGAVVNKDIPPYAIAVGVPARLVGSRKR